MQLRRKQWMVTI